MSIISVALAAILDHFCMKRLQVDFTDRLFVDPGGQPVGTVLTEKRFMKA